MVDEYDDGLWVMRCLRGDPTAFEPLVVRYQRVLFAVALRMLGNHEDARDAVQSAFVRAYERLDTYDPGRKFFSWIYRIAVNECLNAIRARMPTEELEFDMSVDGGALAAVEARELGDRVQAALTTLTREHREVVVLRHFADLSYEEIAESLCIPARTVKSRLFAARERLAGLLAGP
jgi:RNA polymerase sigma-70 factor (ECF subfamily)